MTPFRIIALMDRLGENSKVFGRRFGVSERTVQDWRQGRRKPNPTAKAMLLLLERCGNK